MNNSIQALGSGSGNQAARAKRAATVDYVLRPASNHPIAANRAAAAALRRLSELRGLSKRLDAAYAGAIVLQLLLDSPWLASCTLSFTAEAAYDDDGSCYRSISVTAQDLKPVKRAIFPTHTFSEGAFSQDEAIAWVESQIETEAAALYCAFRSGDDYEELSLGIRRTAAAELLEQLSATGRASGLAAFEALWPQFVHWMRPDHQPV
jgi:hypothetical protein